MKGIMVFDVEADGFLDEMTKLHCLNMRCRKTGKRYRFNDTDPTVPDYAGTCEEGARFLMELDDIGGHNIWGYDLPAIQKIFPWFMPKGRPHDSMAYTRLIWSDIKDRDERAIKLRKRPFYFIQERLTGLHSLRAWGARLGNSKDDYDKGFETYNREMDDYCMQDVEVNFELFELIISKEYSPEALDLENQFLRIISRQEQRGFLFNTDEAQKLLCTLMARRAELTDELQELFPAWQKYDKTITPKRDNKRYGYKAGVPVKKYKTVVFNPNSRDQIADRLITLYGWEPDEFTPTGKPKVDDEILSALPYPPAAKLAEMMMIIKRIGQIAEGKSAWLEKVEDKGQGPRIYGRVNTNGAVTGRCTHFSPNLAQVPNAHAEYGPECRALFTVPEGYKLVGCDADGLELRCLGGYMYRFDGGAYNEIILKGRKEDKTDIHSVNQKIVRMNSRNNAKTFIYAYLYGAGNYKLGTIIWDDMTPEQQAKLKFNKRTIIKLGGQARRRIEVGLPALGKLQELVKAKARRGYLLGQDKRKIKVRSEHAALNTLLQGAGACLMKRALVICDEKLIEAGLIPGEDYEYVANVHDEFQIECKENCAARVATIAADSIRLAGEYYDFRCPLAGSADIGQNWKETH